MTRKKAVELGETWNKNLEAGAKLQGVYTKKEIFKSHFGESNKYVVVKDDRTVMSVFGSASLDNQFNNVPEGSYVWIEYKGEEQSKNGRPVKVYLVEYDDEYKG